MEITKIKNGLTIITHDNKNSNVCTVGYVINSGSYNELENERGIAHFTEHLLFKGTGNRDYKKISSDIEGIGGYLNAETNYLYTKYFCTVPNDKVEIGLDVITDMVFNSIIPEDEFKKEKCVVQEELTMYEDDPSSFVIEKSIEITHENYDNRKNVGGTVQSVGNITRNDVVSFIERNYFPANMTLLVTGNIKHSKVVDFVNKYFNNSKIEFEEYITEYQQINFTDLIATKKDFFRSDINQKHMAICIPGPGIDSKDINAIILSSIILGGNSSSILYNEIREKRGLAYTVSLWVEVLKDSSLICCYSGLNTEKANIDEIIDVIENSKDIVTEENLVSAKNYYNGMLDISTESSKGLHDFYTELISRNDIKSVNDVKLGIEKVSINDIKNVISKYFIKDNMTITTISKLIK